MVENKDNKLTDEELNKAKNAENIVANKDIYKEQIGENKNSKYMGMNFDQKFDFKTIANSFNINSYSISNPEEIGDGLKKCIKSQKPNLIDIHIDG